MPEGVLVEFTGPFREITRTRSVRIEMNSEASLKLLVSRLSDMYGDEFRRRVIDDKGTGLRADSSMVAINQRVIDPADALSQPIKPGDKVVFALSVAGGG
ncbi:MAG TPA: MoaD/ThiS family protein [Thermoproteota archaeon]|nr:MoaD/ThiS family protein [Thermoproteota archaeon]